MVFMFMILFTTLQIVLHLSYFYDMILGRRWDYIQTLIYLILLELLKIIRHTVLFYAMARTRNR